MKTSSDSYDKTCDNEALLGSSPTSDGCRQTWTGTRLSSSSIALWLLVASIGGVAVGLLVGYGLLRPSDDQCVKQTTQTTPLLEDISIHYNTILFNGSFMQANVYRQPAGPEVDKAWEDLGVNYRSVRIEPERGELAGLRSDHVQIKEKYGGGYPANVEGLHHLHCLNLLRQALYWNAPYYQHLGHGAFKNAEPILQLHVTHCLDILRQQLMCTVDVAVFGQVWYKADEGSTPAAFVDFNTNHKCRNYDAVRKWAEARQLPEDVAEDFLIPPREGQRVVNGVP